jgi:3-mercaptopyruvate sulfurtransferase SseA
MPGKVSILFVIWILVLSVSACSTQPAQSPPTQTIEPTLTPTPAVLPLTEAEVPRVTIEEAKAALENGTAVLVDVRSPAAFEVSHVPGALNIQLGAIETNPAGLHLAKDRWIIIYCA